MTSSPDLIQELRATRPSAPADLRARVRRISAEQPAGSSWTSMRLRLPVRRGLFVALPAAAALAIASGVAVEAITRDMGSEECTRAESSNSLI